MFPETGQGSPNTGGINDLGVEFSFVRRLPTTRLTMTIARNLTGNEWRKRSEIQAFCSNHRPTYVPINPSKFRRALDNIEPRYNRLIVVDC